MKGPLIGSVITVLVLLGFAGAYNLGRANRQAEDLPKITLLQQEVDNLQAQKTALMNQQAPLRYEAKTNAWPKFFQCQYENQQWAKWGQQVQQRLSAQQQAQFTPQDAQVLAVLLKAML